MLADRAMADTSKLQLPADLLAELQRRGPTPKVDMRVDGLKTRSFLTRLLELVTGRRPH
jgi:hypothetical protein